MGAYNDDVLFIHIPKCAGTSVKHYMHANLPGLQWPRNAEFFAQERGASSVSEEDKAKAAQSTNDSGLPIGHIPLRDIERYTGRKPESWKKIVGIIRNPYEHQVSQWWFWHKRYAQGEDHPHDLVAGAHPRIHGWLEDPMCDFHVWYEGRFKTGQPATVRDATPANGYEGWGGYYYYWLEVDGAIPGNVQIIKQEDINKELPAALAPFMDHEPPPLGHVNRSSAPDWNGALLAGGNKNRIARSFELINRKFRWSLFVKEFYPALQVSQ